MTKIFSEVYSNEDILIMLVYLIKMTLVIFMLTFFVGKFEQIQNRQMLIPTIIIHLLHTVNLVAWTIMIYLIIKHELNVQDILSGFFCYLNIHNECLNKFLRSNI